ncbi:ribbon-helix-helix domain-containing protein [Prescottella equi]|uniref:ribbon-helix-helix domain-containing protein n=1 Tax=Rhodococcus hoagii TaxID=43767 RepID=UPI001EEAC261|nr:ribbon-helix-helix domain-containing protein [Prescottella equi]
MTSATREERPYRRLNPHSNAPTSPRRTVRFPDVVDQELEALSDETGRSVSKLIREAVTSFIADAKKEAS